MLGSRDTKEIRRQRDKEMNRQTKQILREREKPRTTGSGGDKYIE
jgi:hypothetical protein